MKATLRALLRGEFGQDLIEYGLLSALVSILSIITLSSLGGIMHSMFTMVLFQMFRSKV
jgi:Flp pilus assembly pilin Flp